MLIERAGLMVVTALLVFAHGVRAQAALDSPLWTDPSPHSASLIAVSPDVDLEVLDWGGEGPTMVLLAGLSMNAHAFDEFAPRFVRDFRVIGLTRRGHGASSWPATGYDVATLVEDIRIALDSLRVDRALLVGHSFAGSEMTRFAAEHPDRVLGLVYVDAVQALHGVMLEDLRACPTGPELEAQVDRQFVEPEAFRQTQLRADSGGALLPNAYGPAMGQILQHASEPDYAAVRAPSLAVSYVPERIGEIFFGRPVSESCTRAAQQITYMGLAAFAGGMKRGTIVALREGQHNLHLAAPDELERHIRQWLHHIMPDW
jgi:pimeloyl-ACP methyl ester carboxylesterase